MALLLNPRSLSGFEQRGTLARLPLEGGAPREVLDNVADADWTPNGKELVVVRNDPEGWRIECPAGTAIYRGDAWISHPRVSPKGGRIAFLGHPHTGDDRGYVGLIDMNGHNRKQLTPVYGGTTGLEWSNDGSEVWFSASNELRQNIFAVSLSGRQRMVLNATSSLTVRDISPSGAVLLSQDDRRREIMVRPPGRNEEIDLSWFDYPFLRDLSPDGGLVLFEEEGDGGGKNYSVFLRKTDGSPAIRLADGYGLSLSSDGTRVLVGHPALPPRLMIIPTGPGQPQVLQIPGFETPMFGSIWFPDGKRLLLSGSQAGRPRRYWMYELASGKLTPVTPEGVDSVPWPIVSPDQKSVLAVGLDRQFYLYPVDGGRPVPAKGLLPQEYPGCFAEDRTSVYAATLPAMPLRIYVVNLKTGQRTLWKEIKLADPTGVQDISLFKITPDGKSYAYCYRRILSSLFLVKNLE